MDVDELRGLFLFESLSDEQLHTLMTRSEEVRFVAGDVLFSEGAPADYWWVLLDGRVEVVRRTGNDEEVGAVLENPGQWAGGFRAWSEVGGYLGTGRAASSGRVLRLPAPVLRELADEWFPFGLHLIVGFFQTVRNIDALSRQRAGLVALGTIAAGLAHEINNPAAAAVRAADGLQVAADGLLRSLGELAERSLTAEQFVAIEALRAELDPASASSDPLARSEREDELTDWLDSHGVEEGWRIASGLSEAGATVEWCERLADALDDDTLGPALDWVAGTMTTRALLVEVSEATRRVSGLVEAVRSYTQLDRATVQRIDVVEGIVSTLVVLGHELGEGVTVVREFEEGLPRIDAMPGELNQVWTNLIDNAVDAMDGRGTLRISTRAEPDRVVVEVADTGVGMPEEVQTRAFEAFFTTKDVGKGTGLGLDISRRIVVDRHHGEISIASEPGNTVITVRLPRPALGDGAKEA
ncbi:MAG TPA: ATP-binding protein [Microthrixaceae bacterium]|nr:ATP-binding protein [Microthrixaceae bacterium]